MKTKLMLLILSLLAGTGIRAADALVTDKVHVDATVVTDHRDPKGSPKEIVDKKLTIRLTNHTAETMTDLEVKVTFYARDLTADRDVAEKTLKIKASVAPRRDATVTTDAVTFTYTPDHGVQVKGRRGRVSSKRVPASGHRYAGYSIEISNKTALVGESYSAPKFRKSN